jgi:hypothetical protein
MNGVHQSPARPPHYITSMLNVDRLNLVMWSIVLWWYWTSWTNHCWSANWNYSIWRPDCHVIYWISSKFDFWYEGHDVHHRDFSTYFGDILKFKLCVFHSTRPSARKGLDKGFYNFRGVAIGNTILTYSAHPANKPQITSEPKHIQVYFRYI